MITSTPEGRFVHWKGIKLSDLLEEEDQLVAHLEPLPFQEGKPLATMAEESTELVEASSDELISHQVLMAEEGRTMASHPTEHLTRYPKMRPQPKPATKTTPSVRHEGLGTEPAQPGEGGSTSAYDLCIMNWMPNSLS
jgi:hypothetical protein